MFCGHRTQATDRALGGSVRCPRCKCCYTAAPVENGTARATILQPSPDSEPQAPEEPGLSAPEFPRAWPNSPRQGALVEDIPAAKASAPVKSRRIDLIGLIALFLGAAALLCASASHLAILVRPLAVLGLSIGLVSVVMAWSTRRRRWRYPLAGVCMSASILLAACLLPELLGPAYRLTREQRQEDLTTIRAVPLPGTPGDVPPGNTEWVDASRVALQQGPLTLQVISATIGPAVLPNATKKKGPAPDRLSLRLRARQVESASQFAEKRAGPQGLWAQRPRPMLTDRQGQVYAERDVYLARAEPARRQAFPLATADTVFLFDPPPPGLDYLRLEVPAEAWGGTGEFRFTIPASLIRRDVPGKTAPAARKAVDPRRSN